MTHRYIGLGGYEFIDFDLVYRSLGIKRMISIEDTGEVERYEFNRPFPTITIAWGNTNDELQKLELDPPLIVWLDYALKKSPPGRTAPWREVGTW